MISSREEVEEILKGLGEQLSEPVQFLVIGGAAMLEYGLKDVTKDIDLVCRDATGKARLLEAAKSLGRRRGMLVWAWTEWSSREGTHWTSLPARSPTISGFPRTCGKGARRPASSERRR
jgi:hypothetical protein